MRIPNTYINPQASTTDNRTQNRFSLEQNTNYLWDNIKTLASTSDLSTERRISSLQDTSDSLGEEADILARDLLVDPLEEKSEAEEPKAVKEEVLEAEKEVDAKYKEVFDKQTSLLEEGDRTIHNKVLGNPSLMQQYSDHKKIREVLMADYKKLEEDLQANVLENEEKSKDSVDNLETKPLDKGKRKLEDDIDESSTKRSKKDEVEGENTTEPAAKSLLDDFADISAEMPDVTGSDD